MLYIYSIVKNDQNQGVSSNLENPPNKRPPKMVDFMYRRSSISQPLLHLYWHRPPYTMGVGCRPSFLAPGACAVITPGSNRPKTSRFYVPAYPPYNQEIGLSNRFRNKGNARAPTLYSPHPLHLSVDPYLPDPLTPIWALTG